MLASHWQYAAVDAVEGSPRFDGFLYVGYEAFEGWECFKEFVFEVGSFERVGDNVVVAGFAFFSEAADECFRAFVFKVLRVFLRADSADCADFVCARAVSLMLRLYRFRTASHSCLWGQTISSPVLGAACFGNTCSLLSFEIVVAPSPFGAWLRIVPVGVPLN